MTQLLGLCFDSEGSPQVRLRPETGPHRSRQLIGFGMAWYPAGDMDAALVKDPAAHRDELVTRMLAEWRRFRSTIFLGHMLASGGRRTQQDTHPFRRSHAARGWLLAHNGSLGQDFRTALDLGPSPVFEPLGKTDSEHAFCWLMTRIREVDARRLSDVGWPRLLQWLQQINGCGEANLVITDGVDVVAYHDQCGFQGMHWSRRRPPHDPLVLHNDVFEIDLGDARNFNRTLVAFASQPMGAEGWQPLQSGQMLVARRGSITWDSLEPTTPARPSVDAPATEWVSDPFAPAPPLTPDGPFASCAMGQDHTRTDGGAPAEARTLRYLRTEHETVYRYDRPITRSEHVTRLRPVHDALQQPLSYEFSLTPEGPHFEYEDVFGNQARQQVVETPYQEMQLHARSTVRLIAPPPLEQHPAIRELSLPMVWMPWQRELMQPYLLPTELPEVQLRELSDYALSFAERQDHDLVDTLLDMNRGIFQDFSYIPGSTNLETTPFEVLSARKGVCQDFANLMICLARLLNIPARYRVGYIYTGRKYQNKAQSDASHAWVELYLPGIGWRGFDPTNGCETGLDHVRIACGRNFRDATPTSGTIFSGGGTETLEIQVRVLEVEPGDEPG